MAGEQGGHYKNRGDLGSPEELGRLNLLSLEDGQRVTPQHPHDPPQASASQWGLASQGVTLAGRLQGFAILISQGSLVLQLVLCSMSKRGRD